MQRSVLILLAFLLAFSASLHAQVPVAAMVKIVKAEDERRYDMVLEGLLNSPDAATRARAALAAGRIGDEAAIPELAAMLDGDMSVEVRAMAAFALGETESMLASDALMKAITNEKTQPAVLAKVTEAAGKIVAANAAKGKSKMIDNLGEEILSVLRDEDRKGAAQSRDVVLAGITAALRAHARAGIPGLTKDEIDAVKTGDVVERFLKSPDARVRTDAANTISRARYKKANGTLRDMLKSDSEATASANAATALGRAEDKDAYDLLLKAATSDTDSRVRVSAIRALGALKDAKAADKLLDRGEKLLGDEESIKVPARLNTSELLEIATVLGRLLQNSENERGRRFLNRLYIHTSYHSPEVAIAWARVAPKNFLEQGGARMVLDKTAPVYNWEFATSQAQALAELAASEDKEIKDTARKNADAMFEFTKKDGNGAPIAVPEHLRTLAAFKPEGLSETLREYLGHKDIFVRAAAAELIADQPASKENIAALKTAFNKAFISDNQYNDATLAIIDALYKLDKKESVGILMIAATMPDYLVRKKSIDLLRSKDLEKDFPGLPTTLENLSAKKKDKVLPYNPAFGTKQGQVLNTEADYRRAVSRKNGSVRAIFSTTKGPFTIVFAPEEAPLTVDNFVKLARAKYFNGLAVHRVVPNFVMQDGDPRGDGNGGPGWSIRCEVNMLMYDRGAVGMALSGKDTGGSQWFVTHSPAPHLDGGYTVFGHVDEAGMKVVDNIARGDKILSVMIVEGRAPLPR